MNEKYLLSIVSADGEKTVAAYDTPIAALMALALKSKVDQAFKFEYATCKLERPDQELVEQWRLTVR